jgi:hypothetical protein
VAALVVSDPNEDEENWVVPPPKPRKGQLRWSTVIRERNLRRPGQNLAQFIYYQAKARRIAKAHEKKRLAEEARFQEWADHIEDYIVHG